MDFFKIERIQSVVGVHVRLQNRQIVRVCGKLIQEKIQSRRTLSADDQSTGMQKIIPFQKRALRLVIIRLSRRRRTFRTLKILRQLFLADPQLLADFGGGKLSAFDQVIYCGFFDL